MINQNEFHIDNKNKPEWENDEHGNPLDLKYQSQDVQDYYRQEIRKLKVGMNISGVQIHPWTYYHVNYWNLFTDKTDEKTGYTTTTVVNPFFRDNEWVWNQSLLRAEKEKKGIIAFGTRRFSKALKNSEVVYTKGWVPKPIGEVKVGEKIYGEDRMLTTITGVYPQGSVQLYEVMLADGSSVECCIDHLWHVFDRTTLEYRTLALGDILNSEHQVDNFTIPVLVDINKFDQSKLYLRIDSIEPTTVDLATCIEVDNESKLFVTSNYIITHNSAFIGSYIGFNATTKYGGSQRVNSVVGGSDPDLENVISYIDFGLNNLEPFLRYPRSGTDWGKGISLGTVYDNNEKDIFSKITVTNLDAGKSKATQKTAGATPMSWVCDEIGKQPYKKAFNTAKASFEAVDGSGWRCVPILIGTSGEVEQAQDAFSMVHSPEAYNLIEMDWGLLEEHCEEPTWKKKVFGIFVPAQMSMKTGVTKYKTNLGAYLKNDAPALKKIKFQATEWEKSTKAIHDNRKLLKKSPDKKDYNDDVMFYPLDTDDCFLRAGDNPFPSQRAQIHMREIQQSGDCGKAVDMFSIGSSKNLGYTLSSKLAPDYPFGGGIADAPMIMFEEPPEDNTIDGTYVAGLDHYKHTKAGTSSLGCLTIYKRKVNINDIYEDSLVLIYTARPKSMYEFNKNCEMLLEGYGAVCLQENADISFQSYLERKYKDHILLADGLEMIRNTFNPHAKQNNNLGLPPTPKNKEYLLKLAISYCWEEIEVGIDEDGVPITDLGVIRIKDIGLLKEIVDFMTGDNFDRLTSFQHALAWARYLDSLRIMPKVKVKGGQKNKKRNVESVGVYGNVNRKSGGMY